MSYPHVVILGGGFGGLSATGGVEMAERELDGMAPGLREVPGGPTSQRTGSAPGTFPLDLVRLDAREGVGR